MFHLSGTVLHDADSWERCLVSGFRNIIEISVDLVLYSRDCSILILQQSIVIDLFWKQSPLSVDAQQFATAISAPLHSARVCVPAKPMSTMEERSIAKRGCRHSLLWWIVATATDQY